MSPVSRRFVVVLVYENPTPAGDSKNNMLATASNGFFAMVINRQGIIKED